MHANNQGSSENIVTAGRMHACMHAFVQQSRYSLSSPDCLHAFTTTSQPTSRKKMHHFTPKKDDFQQQLGKKYAGCKTEMILDRFVFTLWMVLFLQLKGILPTRNWLYVVVPGLKVNNIELASYSCMHVLRGPQKRSNHFLVYLGRALLGVVVYQQQQQHASITEILYNNDNNSLWYSRGMTITRTPPSVRKKSRCSNWSPIGFTGHPITRFFESIYSWRGWCFFSSINFDLTS